MFNKLDISVITPAFNNETYINKCISSIINQENKNIEVIIIDDGSNDKTGEVLDCYSLFDSRMCVVHTINNGVSNARNIGIVLSNGKYITFVDGDDWIEKDYYINAIREINDNDLLIYGIYINYNESKNIESNINNSTYLLDKKEAINKILSDNYYKGFLVNKIYKSSIIKKNHILISEEIKYCEDLLFNVRYILNCLKIKYHSMPVYHYRIHDNSVVEGGKHSDIYTGVNAYKRITKVIKMNGLLSENISKKIKHNISSLSLKSMRNMSLYNYDKASALLYRNTFLENSDIYIESSSFEGRIMALMFKMNPRILYSYFRLRSYIKKVIYYGR